MRIGITGISGSLGTALTERLVGAGIGPIVGISRDEFKCEIISQKYGGMQGQVRAMVVAEGINDTEKLVEVFRGCELLIHAAALKRISGSVYATQPMVETNVTGTISVLKAAQRAKIPKVMVVSSDKACMPANLYGGTKFIAECLAVQENAFSYPAGTKISCVRYGNVLGSRGSVVPLWREQAANGLPLMVTDERMTRFIITMNQAVEFIMASMFSMKGGEVFVPILPAARMVDLALAISSNIVIKNERRPGGEKLAEALLSEEEPTRTVYRELQGGLLCGAPIRTYMVLPSYRTWSAEPYMGRPIDAAMTYRSDEQVMLSQGQLQALLAEIPETFNQGVH